MIFPLLKGIISPLKVPATFLIVLVNIVIFLFCLETFDRSQQQIEKILSDRDMIMTQGLIFSQFIETHPADYRTLMKNVAQKSLNGDLRASHQMGGLAIRNSKFMKEALDFKPNGNDIEIDKWRTHFKEVLELQKNHPSYYLGLTDQHNSWTNWFSYQFTHSGFSHLFWNMIFLIMLGCFVESEAGSGVLVFTYLSSGLFGAFTFSLFSGISAIPLVGASAAISGLVGFAIFNHWNKKVEFFFWLLPIQNYFGLTKLPGWTLLVIFCLPDIAGQFSSVSEFGSIAYAAHIGGAICGGFIGFLYKVTASPEVVPATLD